MNFDTRMLRSAIFCKLLGLLSSERKIPEPQPDTTLYVERPKFVYTYCSLIYLNIFTVILKCGNNILLQ